MHFKLKLTTMQERYSIIFDFINTLAVLVLVGYLDKRAQVVLQALLMTSGDYMYDHPESTEHGSVILAALLSVLNSTKCSHI